MRARGSSSFYSAGVGDNFTLELLRTAFHEEQTVDQVCAPKRRSQKQERNSIDK